MHLLLGGPDRTSAKGLVFVDKHAQHGVLHALIARPIWLFRFRSSVGICPSPFLVLGVGKELTTRVMIGITMTSRCP